MNLKQIYIKHFKSLYDVSFKPGKINVFIGANGSGKTTVLESIGLLSAAMTDRVDDASLQRKGVRLSVPTLYKSNFKDIERRNPTILLSLEWDDNDVSHSFKYNVHLTPPTNTDYWKYHSEAFYQDGIQKWGRSNASRQQSNNYIGFFLIDDDKDLESGRKTAKALSNYGIFQPNTMTLRGMIPDPSQSAPLGLNGGRLAEAIKELLFTIDDNVMFGDIFMDDVLEMIDWASNISVSAPKRNNINANIPTTRQVIEFADRYMKNSVQFTGYDASEGALYVLFMLALAMHPQGPAIFAVDSFDHALNPHLAKKMTEVFCQEIIKNGKTAFLTTHSPLVLDGLDITNDEIRLFAVDRDSKGHSQITRITVSPELLAQGQSLSRLWINGRLGGVPTLL
ncbi:AAA family ATPase [uncultured Oscillibacter sp.]|uniref:AAA family ATPase n=1 Tax=uncultured Oscillibacter sp. TaxID=876091 RepID=UPI0025DFC60A|nr:ATP-binding protein [uncultured Oscillibacter sp.]